MQQNRLEIKRKIQYWHFNRPSSGYNNNTKITKLIHHSTNGNFRIQVSFTNDYVCFVTPEDGAGLKVKILSVTASKIGLPMKETSNFDLNSQDNQDDNNRI
ncbi:hypothetical protein ACTA71_007259 [Dictyostelium dimigraforme]